MPKLNNRSACCCNPILKAEFTFEPINQFGSCTSTAEFNLLERNTISTLFWILVSYNPDIGIVASSLLRWNRHTQLLLVAATVHLGRPKGVCHCDHRQFTITFGILALAVGTKRFLLVSQIGSLHSQPVKPRLSCLFPMCRTCLRSIEGQPSSALSVASQAHLLEFLEVCIRFFFFLAQSVNFWQPTVPLSMPCKLHSFRTWRPPRLRQSWFFCRP